MVRYHHSKCRLKKTKWLNQVTCALTKAKVDQDRVAFFIQKDILWLNISEEMLKWHTKKRSIAVQKRFQEGLYNDLCDIPMNNVMPMHIC